MDLNLKGKIIIVTGGAAGIGQAITESLATEGAIPVIVGRNSEENENVLNNILSKDQMGFQVKAELTQPDQCKNAVSKVLKRFNRIDGLVNNAGINDGVGLENGDYQKFMASLHNNLVHYYLMAHFCLPALKTSRGSILNISSKTAETGQGETSAYAASNGGRNALTREWAVELLKYGIRVNALIVAECWTPAYKEWVKTFPNPEEKTASIAAHIPLGNRMTTPEEIANMTLFLLSSRSSHTTGQLIHVDGGYVHLDRGLANNDRIR